MSSAGLDYFGLLKESKRLDHARLTKSVRVALLADCSTQHLVPILKALLARDGFWCEVHEAQFDAIALEAYGADSPLYAFRPDVIIVLNTTAALRHVYDSFDGTPAAFARDSMGRVAGIWDALKRNSGATIVQTTFAVPYDRLFGSYEVVAGASFPSAVGALNALIVESARRDPLVLLCDVEYVSAYAGRARWFDEKLWLLSKSPCALECLPRLASSLAAIVRALRGRSIKCVVVDLDDTLWGGVIGDDGLEGIQLGDLQGGAAFQAFQRFLLSLKKRGILLAVCSRNDPETARLPFRSHPDMVLKEGDLAAFVANWESKADNIRAIQKALDIGLDSMLFLDDDPFERDLVRRTLPEVTVPDMPEDPADFVKALCERDLFEAVAFSEEDRRRADQYGAEAQRRALKGAFSSMDDYLASLGMHAAVARFDQFHLPRIVQLISRSNQFNLMTRRYGLADCQRFMHDAAGYLPFYVTLKDKLGDSGLIAAVVLRRAGRDLEIDEWVMSCRVLLRGVEELTLNAIVGRARAVGARRIIGRYRPTEKNRLVKDLYARLSFERAPAEDGDGEAWALDVSGYVDRRVRISQETEAGKA